MSSDGRHCFSYSWNDFIGTNRQLEISDPAIGNVDKFPAAELKMAESPVCQQP